MVDRTQKIIGLSLLSGILAIGIIVMAFSGDSDQQQTAGAQAGKQKASTSKATTIQKQSTSKKKSTHTAKQQRIEPDTRLRKTSSTRSHIGPPSKRYSRR